MRAVSETKVIYRDLNARVDINFDSVDVKFQISLLPYFATDIFFYFDVSQHRGLVMLHTKFQPNYRAIPEKKSILLFMLNE